MHGRYLHVAVHHRRAYPGHPVEQMADSKQIDSFFQRNDPFFGRDAFHSILQIVFDGKMQEEGGILKDETDRTFMGRDEDFIFIVLPYFVANADFSIGRLYESGDSTRRVDLPAPDSPKNAVIPDPGNARSKSSSKSLRVTFPLKSKFFIHAAC